MRVIGSTTGNHFFIMFGSGRHTRSLTAWFEIYTPHNHRPRIFFYPVLQKKNGLALHGIGTHGQTSGCHSNTDRHGETQLPGSRSVVARHPGKTTGLLEQPDRFAVAARDSLSDLRSLIELSTSRHRVGCRNLGKITNTRVLLLLSR